MVSLDADNSLSKDKSTVDVVQLSENESGKQLLGHYDDIGAKYADMVSDGYSKKEEKKILRKMDMFLMPFLWLNVTFAAMDKVSHSQAALYGMREDLNLVGTQYSWIGSAFYFGYLFWCFPAGIILQRLPVAKMAGSAFVIWGFMLIGSGFAKNFATMVSLRVLLGITEAPILPINLIIVSMWYVKGPEQTLRIGLFYTGLSTVFTGTLSYAVGGYHDTALSVWRYYYFIIGALSTTYGILMFLLLPDSPVSCKYLSDREKAIVIDRVRKNKTGIKNSHFKKDQFMQTIKDPKIWVMFWVQIFISIPNGGLTNFATLIVQGLGWSARTNCLLTIPNGLCQTISVYSCSLLIYLLEKFWPKKQFRGTVLCVFLIPPFVATGCLYKLPETDYVGRLISLYFGFFYLGPYIVTLNLITCNTAGFTRKITVNALMFTAYSVSNIIAPQFFKASQEPLYSLGVGALFGAYCLTVFSMLVYMFLCYRENLKRDRLYGIPDNTANKESDLADLTDLENKDFRYKW